MYLHTHTHTICTHKHKRLDSVHPCGHTYPQTHCISMCKQSNAHLTNSHHDYMQTDNAYTH